jgi:hypothetical protein
VSQSWLRELRRWPVIAAVRDEAAPHAALDSPAVEERAVFVHLDLVEGISKINMAFTGWPRRRVRLA